MVLAVASGSGDSVVISGGGLIVSVAGSDCTPPGLITRMLAVPGVRTSWLDTEPRISVLLTNCVPRMIAFHCTIDPELLLLGRTKPLPITVTVMLPAPAVVAVGLMLVMRGAVV
jgi:hypothetical protein